MSRLGIRPWMAALAAVGLEGGCLLFGARLLEDDWGQASTQCQYGLQTPIARRCTVTPAWPEIGAVSTMAVTDDGFVTISELFAGAYVEPGNETCEMFSGRHAIGAGLSYLLAYETRYEAGEQLQDELTAAYVYYRVQIESIGPRDTGFVGFEARYTMPLGTLTGMSGSSPGGVQLMVWWWGF